MPGPNPTVKSFNLFQSIVTQVINIRRNSRRPNPSDGFILRMHYQWMFWFMIAVFGAVWYSWYHRDVIVCVSQFNAEIPLKVEYTNVCLSYPYLNGSDAKRYLMFYRWTHWIMLCLAAVYYLPRKFLKKTENRKLNKIFHEVSLNTNRYDCIDEDKLNKVTQYFAYNMGSHDEIYHGYIISNIVALISDAVTFAFLHWLFQYRFGNLIYNSWPFNRDNVEFSDYLSVTFPPFVDCQLTPQHELVSNRTEVIGCHLVLMEFYEKVYVVLWLVLVLIITITSLYTLFLACFKFKRFYKPLLKYISNKLSSPHDDILIEKMVAQYGPSDMYVLYKLSEYLNNVEFYYLFRKLTNKDLVGAFRKMASMHIGKAANRARDAGDDCNQMRKANKGLLVE